MKTVTQQLLFWSVLSLLALISRVALAAEPAPQPTTYEWSNRGLPVRATRGDVTVDVVWNETLRAPLEVTWNHGAKRVFTYDEGGRRVATHNERGELISQVEYASKPGFPSRIRETTIAGTRTILLDDLGRVIRLIDTTDDERVSTFVHWHANGLPDRIEYRVETKDNARLHFDGGETEDGVIVEVDYDYAPPHNETDVSGCSSLPPDELNELTNTIGQVRPPRIRLTTWLLTGGQKWKASDEEIAWATQDMRDISKWYNTAAGYGALVGVVLFFEDLQYLQYDFLRAPISQENNSFVDLTNALLDRGPIIIVEGFLDQVDRAMKGDAVAFGQLAFSLYLGARGAGEVDVSTTRVSFPHASPILVGNGELAMGTVSTIAVPKITGLSGLVGPGTGVMLMAGNKKGGGQKQPRREWSIDESRAERIGKHVRTNEKYYKITSKKGRSSWWSKDTSHHGGSRWKVYKETKKGLEWVADADEFGDFMDKHKSPVGRFIPWKDLAMIK